MIVSMGVDIIEIDEIKNSIQRSKRFLERVYTEKEIWYCESKINKFSSYAARFAAKEAVMKALGTGWSNGIQWKHIEVRNYNYDEAGNSMKALNIYGGKPEILLHREAQQRAKDMGINNIIVSLSHSNDYAVATVMFQSI